MDSRKPPLVESHQPLPPYPQRLVSAFWRGLLAATPTPAPVRDRRPFYQRWTACDWVVGIGLISFLALVLWALVSLLNGMQRTAEDAARRARESVSLTSPAAAEEMPNEHAKQMWILAADMAMAGYCWSGSPTVLEMTMFDLDKATSGTTDLSPPDPGPFTIEWSIDRWRERGAWSFLVVTGKEGYSTTDAVQNEWERRMRSRLPAETFRAASSLIADASSIYQADSGHGTWNGFGGRPVVIKERGWSDPESKGWREYVLVLEEVAGDYRLEVEVFDEPDTPWYQITVNFTYQPLD